MASPVCAHAPCSVGWGQCSGMDCQFVEGAVGYFLLFHARSKCVCILFIYTVVIVCKYENLLLCVEASQSM